MTLRETISGSRIDAVTAARGLFAVALASLALWILAFGQWVPQPVPASIALRGFVVYGAALVILAASVGLCFERTARMSVLTLGAYLALSAALATPEILSKPLSIGAWYPCCEALTAFAGAWALDTMLRRPLRRPRVRIGGSAAMRAARILLGLTCVFYGGSHFVYAGYTAAMVPAWLPGRLALAYVTGACHVIAGLALVVGIFPRLAAALEATMMSAFGLLVWVPSFYMQPRPSWATPPAQQWSELVVTFVLAGAAWVVAIGVHTDGRDRVGRKMAA